MDVPQGEQIRGAIRGVWFAARFSGVSTEYFRFCFFGFGVVSFAPFYLRSDNKVQSENYFRTTSEVHLLLLFFFSGIDGFFNLLFGFGSLRGSFCGISSAWNLCVVIGAKYRPDRCLFLPSENNNNNNKILRFAALQLR